MSPIANVGFLFSHSRGFPPTKFNYFLQVNRSDNKSLGIRPNVKIVQSSRKTSKLDPIPVSFYSKTQTNCPKGTEAKRKKFCIVAE